MEEYADLWERYREGDRQAYEALVDAYLPLVKVTVGRLSLRIPSHISREDLLSAGAVGLLSAIERYDDTREAKFSSYAITRIRGAVIDELRQHDILGRVTRDRVGRIQEAEAGLQSAGEEPTPERVAEVAGLSEDEYWDAIIGMQASRRISLSEVSDDGEHTLADLIASRRNDSPGQEIELEEIITLVDSWLTDKERMMVVLYYKEELTLKEIGAVMNVSESRVCQMHTQMSQRVRKKLEKIGIML